MRARIATVIFATISLCTALGALGFAREASEPPAQLSLNKAWQLQSSCQDPAGGAKVSTVGFGTNGWHHADLPATVVGALVDDKTYPDPTFGKNFSKLPGMGYSTKTFFANQELPKDSPFRCSWWFRTEFDLPDTFEGRNTWLHFLGINYRANVWINGVKIADERSVAGTFVTFEFNATKMLRAGKRNAIAVEVFAPGKGDLGITWVDWNPTPADKDMGIWKDVYLTSTADVAVRNPFVSSKLDSEYKTAALTISADLENVATHSVTGRFVADLEGRTISQDVGLAAGEVKTVTFSPEKFSELKLTGLRLWWPYQMGEPNLYHARVRFEVTGQNSDSAEVTFGIREISSEITGKGYRLFKVNGRKVLIRGAAWAPDMFLRWLPGRLDADFAYVRDMGLNTVRLEGRIDREELFDKADKMGILIMPGWTCCDAWELWKNWKPEQHKIAEESLRSQIRILRNHPSVFVWFYGSDGPPPADVEKMYLGVLKDLDWPNPSVSSAADVTTRVTGKSGVKMTGPYEYVPPVYWLADKEAGGAYGYNTETSPGPAIPTRESLERFIPKDHLWPIDDFWNYHAGGERFTTINVFTNALNRRYGPATSLDDYERKAQAMTYDGQRAMFEAYGRNKYTATGVVQWMLNNSWPSLIWHLYDYYLVPAGGYFGTKKSTEPIHVQYSYDDNSVAVVNSTYEAIKGAKASAKLYGLDAGEKASRDVTLDLAPDASVKAFDLPKVSNLSKTYFLKLQLHDANGKLLSDNFYWLSTQLDTLDWKHKQDTVYTPQAEFADLTGLSSLPAVRLAVSASGKQEGSGGIVHVSVRNPGNAIAFQVHLRLARGTDGQDVTPILWQDNYFSLLPGESRDVEATYHLSDLDGHQPRLVVDGFNVAPTSPELSPSGSTPGSN